MTIPNTDKDNIKVVPTIEKNILLYGPPATGKTYETVNYAVAICDERPLEEVQIMGRTDVLARYQELEAEGRIVFSRFHPTLHYEQFMEGPSAFSDEVEDGLFKRFCKQAGAQERVAQDGAKIKANPTVWKVTLKGDGMNDIKEDCYRNGRIRIGYASLDRHTTEHSHSGNMFEHRMLASLEYKMEIGDLVVVDHNRQTIDGVGVIAGDYEWLENGGMYPRSRKVDWLRTDVRIDVRELGIRKELSERAVHKLAVNAEKLLDAVGVPEEESFTPTPYVFIMDEMDQGYVSEIFGEVSSLLDPSRRKGGRDERSAVLPYSGESFSIPENVYVIGTAETVETAQIESFGSREMMPRTDILPRIGGLDLGKMLETINARIEYLLGREYMIGHGYLMPLVEDARVETLGRIFRGRIIPLLRDYFRDDYEKIQLVLGDNGKTDPGYKFIANEPVKVKELFKGAMEQGFGDKRYYINEEALWEIESYKQI